VKTLDRQQNVLLISFAFPPTGGPGVQRSAKFAKYLPEFGWRPIVWASGPIESLPSDPSLVDELPSELAVHRHPDAHQAHGTNAGQVGVVGTGLWDRFKDRLNLGGPSADSAARHPDEFFGWALTSVEPLMSLIHDRHVSVIYSTFSPASNHCLAMELKVRTGLPWVADFRDLWTDDYRYRAPSSAWRAADHRLQKRILEIADAVIGVTPRQTDILANHLFVEAAKFGTITNGFDGDDFAEAVAPRNADEDFVLAHIGRLDRYRSPEALFGGLERFLESIGSDRSRFVLRVVGHAGKAARDRLDRMDVRVEYTGYLSHAAAIRSMRQADANLLMVPTGPNGGSVIPAKLFEYLAAQRPVLVVGPDGGECDRIVRETQSGLSVGFDAEAIAKAVHRLFDDRSRGCPMPGCDRDRLAPYDRKALTGSLAAVFDRVWRGYDSSSRQQDLSSVGVS